LYSQLSAVPGIDAVTAASTIPLSSYYNLSNIAIEGRPPDPPGHEPRAIYNNVRANYFRLLGIPLLAGRTFGSQDRADGPPSVVVSREFTRRYLPGREPLGTQIRMFRASRPWTIVGVVGDIREDGMDRPPQPYVYTYDEQSWFPAT